MKEEHLILTRINVELDIIRELQEMPAFENQALFILAAVVRAGRLFDELESHLQYRSLISRIAA